jgi:apolipoprotein N-acyltransferase
MINFAHREMKKYRLVLYAIASGLLLTPGWFVWGTGLTLLFALVPILFVEDFLYQNLLTQRPHKVILYSAITFFTWNILTTWWIVNSTFVGMLLAIVINTVLMSTVFWAFHITRRNAGSGPGYFGLIVYWLVYEHFYLNGEISWPWLDLGNGFMNDIHIIQWYEITGIFGGTLWVLLSNILIFLIIKNYATHKSFRNKIALLITWILLIIIPVTYSIIRFRTYKETPDPREIVIVQPNIDPYNEKFGGMEASRQMDKMLGLASAAATAQTDYFVAPETFINDNIWEDEMSDNPSIRAVYGFLKKYPGAKFVLGLTYYKAYTDSMKLTPTAHPIPGTDLYYDSFNAGCQLDSTDNIQIYIKSKLVVGVEKMPYTQYLGFLEKLTLKLGGTFRSHGTQEYRESLFAPDDSVGVATVICYESVYGEFVTEYIKAGSNYIFVITNDGWWGDTPGHRQHLGFSRLRAIETRRSVARSANTGISAFINQKGEILLRTKYWTADTLRTELNANDAYTFYVKHGDFIAKAAYFFALIIILYTIVRVVLRKKS